MTTNETVVPALAGSADAIGLPANSARNFKVGAYERAADDWYVEPRWCVDQLIGTGLFARADDAIYDPCCGGGNIPEAFRAHGFETWATDKVDRGYDRLDGIADAAFPALMVGPPSNRPVSVVTNPPFALAEQMVRVHLELADRRVAILQQLSFLASKARHALFTEFPPSDILILSRRPSMPPGHLIADLGDRAFKGGTTDYCWIVWTKPHDRETRVCWLAPETIA